MGIKAKFSPTAAERMRGRIQTDKILQVLNAAALGEKQISTGQAAAINIALKKVMPDLTATELSGEVARPTVIRAPATVSDSRTWLEQYGPEQRVTDTVSDKPLN